MGAGASPDPQKIIAQPSASLRPPPGALTITDLEDQLDSLLRSHGQDDLWQLAAELAHRGIKPPSLESLFENLDAALRLGQIFITR